MKIYLLITNISVNLHYKIRNIDFKMQVAYPDILLLWKKEKGEQSKEKLICLALNINVCFVAIPFQEDPAPAVERLNDTDYLFGKPHETGWLIMHDTKMFLFTHRYGFEPGFSFLFFSPETWFTGLKWIEGRVAGQQVSTGSWLWRLAP